MSGVLYFFGFRTPEPGDFIVAYRNQSSVGNIAYYGNGEIAWSLSIGQLGEKGFGCPSIDAAKAEITIAFEEWCNRQGLIVDGDSVTPDVCKIDWPKMIIDEALSKPTSKEVLSFMQGREQQRRMKELVKYDRGVIRHKVEEYRQKLLQQEHEAEMAKLQGDSGE